MKLINTLIPDVKLIEPDVFEDERGFFMESWNQANFNRLLGQEFCFVQDNHSRSTRGVLRGLHYQIKNPQGKLLRVTAGEVYDVVVDIRRSSPTFGKWIGEYLSNKNKKMLWVPEGFAHGFYVISEMAEFQYKCTNYYSPEHERCIVWNDPEIGIDWPKDNGLPELSPKDLVGDRLSNSELFP